MTRGGVSISTATLVGGSSYSVDSAPPVARLTQYIAALSATLGAFAMGNVLGWTSPTSETIQSGLEYGFTVSDTEFSWVGSLLTVGAAISALPTGYLVDKVGRKNTMFYIAVPFAAGWALISWAVSVEMFYAGRIITGFCGGIFCVASPLYIGEIAEKEIRGSLGTYYQLMLVIGIEFTYIIGAFVSVFVLSIISGVVPLLFAAIFFWIPDSPQYYLKNGQLYEARRALQWFRGGGNTNVDHELREMTLAAEAEVPVPLKKTFKSYSAKKAMLISLGMMAIQQLSGINAVVFYTQTIFKNAGSTLESRYAVMIVGAVQLISTVVSAVVVDRLGRRLLLLLSISVMAVCTLILGVYLFFFENDPKAVVDLGWLPLVVVCLYFVAFSLGVGPIPWLMLGELFATEIKGTASALSALLNWFLAFIVTRFYADLVEAFNGSTTFWIFTAFLVIGFVIVIVFLPETRGKTLEEIQMDLGVGSSTINNANTSHVSGPEKQI